MGLVFLSNVRPADRPYVHIRISQHHPFFNFFFFFKVLNKTQDFEDAVRKVINDVNLDNDIVVSVFETNIRVLG